MTTKNKVGMAMLVAGVSFVAASTQLPSGAGDFAFKFLISAAFISLLVIGVELATSDDK